MKTICKVRLAKVDPSVHEGDWKCSFEDWLGDEAEGFVTLSAGGGGDPPIADAPPPTVGPF